MRGLVVLLVASSACLDGSGRLAEMAPTTPAVPTQSSEAPVTLRVGETAGLAGTEVRLTFGRVSDDSRCPKGTTCIWEGDAVVEIRVESRGAEPGRLALHVNPGFAQRGTAGGVTVALVRLEPYPEPDAPVPAGAYVATLAVSRP